MSLEAAGLLAQVLPVLLLVITIQNRNRSDDELRLMPLRVHTSYVSFMFIAAAGGTTALLFCLLAVMFGVPLPTWQAIIVMSMTLLIAGAFMIEMMGATGSQVKRALQLHGKAHAQQTPATAAPLKRERPGRGCRARRAQQSNGRSR
ncbi:hypothetical protein MT349_17590 [Rathayibacter caricis]|uniref:hypothetical protein n=1 Tax=Rathayibacter caricis TaxID=110936 RepID=UPI001FB221F6|nr:hypothetical protein [Rathayibacter caricis]MCJ1697598.1 hypothetical protein [Rathayibacter caricis]